MHIRDSIIKLISTFLYIGYLPGIPGTFASLAGLFLFYLVRGTPFLYAFLTLLFIGSGLLATTRAEKIFGEKDANCIVIDEVAGLFLCFVYLPFDLKLLIAGFLIFRILDTLKPYPADRLQDLKGGLGIMSDDLVAGFYTNIILQIVARLLSFKAS